MAASMAAELEADQQQTGVIDYEVDQILLGFDSELLMHDRHITTSNDRYQVSAANLAVARTHYIVADAIAKTMTDPNASGDYRSTNFSQDEVVDFIRSGYGSAATYMDVAKTVSSQLGYRAGYPDQESLRHAEAIHWLSADRVSRKFIEGAIMAGDKMLWIVGNQQESLRNSRFVSGAVKKAILTQVDMLQREALLHHAAIQRTVNTGSFAKYPERFMEETYNDAQSLIAGMQAASVHMLYPTLRDPGLALRQPLVEGRPNRNAFDPRVLGTASVTPQVVIKPPTEQRRQPKRPFDARALGQETTGQQEPHERRPFDPAALFGQGQPDQAAEVEHETGPRKPFDPTQIYGSEAEQTERQDPSSQNDAEHRRPFDPSTIYGSQETEE